MSLNVELQFTSNHTGVFLVHSINYHLRKDILCVLLVLKQFSLQTMLFFNLCFLVHFCTSDACNCHPPKGKYSLFISHIQNRSTRIRIKVD